MPREVERRWFVKVSVLMVTYNQEDYIAQSIESALAQKTNFDYEIVIGEDCSTDQTRRIVERFAARYPERIRVLLHPTNLGLQGRNNFQATFRACRGAYVALLEGDDYWTSPDKLQVQSDFLDRHREFSMCFTNGSIVDEKGQIKKGERLLADRKRNLTQKDIVSGLIPPSNTAMFRRDSLKEFPSSCADILNGDFLIFSVITGDGDAGYLDLNTGAYRIHGKSVWSQQTESYQCLHYIKSCHALLGLFRDKYFDILHSAIRGALARLLELGSREEKREPDFTEGGFWTPQTQMLRDLRASVDEMQGSPRQALSIDRNPSLDGILMKKWPALSIQWAEYPEYDAQDLHPFADERFDLVYSHQVLEHIPKPWEAAREMVRVLKRGGIGIHTSCAFNPRHGQPVFKDYYRFLPEGLEELFEGVKVLRRGEWGNKQAILYNVAIDDGHGDLGGRRFNRTIGEKSDGVYPWHTWIIFRKG